MSRIVVGVDGSASSAEALQWALDEARRRQAPLEVVMTWEYSPLYASAAQGVFLPPGSEDDLAGAAHATVAKLLADAGLTGDDDVEIIETVVPGSAAPALLDASKGADMLVVGSRGLGGFKGMMLGSVSQHCVSHATCPVVVVRGETDEW
jgi:nucleotide-binding universal stress UspA family protein